MHLNNLDFEKSISFVVSHCLPFVHKIVHPKNVWGTSPYMDTAPIIDQLYLFDHKVDVSSFRVPRQDQASTDSEPDSDIESIEEIACI
jgi:hypothetical protein